MTARTPEHVAALDALEALAHSVGIGESERGKHTVEVIVDVFARSPRVDLLVRNGLMVVCHSDGSTPDIGECPGHARFVVGSSMSPKPRLTEEEVEETMRLADAYHTISRHGFVERRANGEIVDVPPIQRNKLRTYLTSLTQEGE